MRSLLLTVFGFLLLSCTENNGKLVSEVICIDSSGDTVAIYETTDCVKVYPKSSINHNDRTSVFHTTSGEIVCCSTEDGKIIIKTK